MTVDPYHIPGTRYDSTREQADREGHEDLTRDVAFNRRSINDAQHVSPFDNGTICVGTDNIEVRLVQGIDEENFLKVLSKATRATIGIEPDEDEVVDRASAEEMFKGGLQTALETAVVVFEVRGVSRTCTHQLVRTRKASFHQQSQRASDMGQLPEVRMPESIWRNTEARRAFTLAVHAAHQAYNVAADNDISFQDARFALPEGTTNYILCEYPLREFINVYNYRGCTMFQWEIVKVMRLMRDALVEAHPWLDEHIKISCERTHPDPAQRRCTFQGWERVDEQCDFEWAREENRTYKPSENLSIGKKLPIVDTPMRKDLEEMSAEELAEVIEEEESEYERDDMAGPRVCPNCGEAKVYLWTRHDGTGEPGSQFWMCAERDYKEEVL